jgi:pantothenate kinase-related protein Tda10
MKIKYITNNVQDYSVVYDKVVHLVVFQTKNTTMSNISKIQKEEKLVLLAHKYMTAHFPGLVLLAHKYMTAHFPGLVQSFQ